jgi:hypothetical protein
MALSSRAPAAGRGPTDPTRKTAFVAGVLYLLTFASSIAAVILVAPAVSNPDYILGAGSDGMVRLGAFFDLVNALTLIGTGVALYSVTKRHHEGLALGFVATRMFEGAVLSVGVMAVLSIAVLRQGAPMGGDSATLVTAGEALATVQYWSFYIGTGMAALNASMLATVMYRSRLVPRVIPALGLIGVVTFGSWTYAHVLGITEPGSAWATLGVAPIFVWELALGLWMTFKGFRAPAVAALGFDVSDGGSSNVVPQGVAATKAGVA